MPKLCGKYGIMADTRFGRWVEVVLIEIEEIGHESKNRTDVHKCAGTFSLCLQLLAS